MVIIIKRRTHPTKPSSTNVSAPAKVIAKCAAMPSTSIRRLRRPSSTISSKNKKTHDIIDGDLSDEESVEDDDDDDFEFDSSASSSEDVDGVTSSEIESDVAKIHSMLKFTVRDDVEVARRRALRDAARMRDNLGLGGDGASSDESGTLSDVNVDVLYDDQSTIQAFLSVGNTQTLLTRIENNVITPLCRFGYGGSAGYQFVVAAVAYGVWHCVELKKPLDMNARCMLCRSTKTLSYALRDADSTTIGYCGRDCAAAYQLLCSAHRLRRDFFRAIGAQTSSRELVRSSNVDTATLLATRLRALERSFAELLRRRERRD